MLYIEVIIDNKYFVPWESQIEFNKEVQASAAPVIEEMQAPPKPVDPAPIIEEAQDYAEPIIEEIQEVRAPIEMKPRRTKKTIDNVRKENKNNKVRMDMIDRTFADIMEQDRITDELMNSLFKGSKEKKVSKSNPRRGNKARIQNFRVKEGKAVSRLKKEKNRSTYC